MHLGNSLKHENSEDIEATLGMEHIQDKGEREEVVLGFKSENGQSTSS